MLEEKSWPKGVRRKVEDYSCKLYFSLKLIILKSTFLYNYNSGKVEHLRLEKVYLGEN